MLFYFLSNLSLWFRTFVYFFPTSTLLLCKQSLCIVSSITLILSCCQPIEYLWRNNVYLITKIGVHLLTNIIDLSTTQFFKIVNVDKSTFLTLQM